MFLIHQCINSSSVGLRIESYSHATVSALTRSFFLTPALSFCNVPPQNLTWALGYNAVAIPVAAGVLWPAYGIELTPTAAGLLMSISSLAVVTNSLRLGRKLRSLD